MNKNQFRKNIKWINKWLRKDYPGAKLIWPVGGNPEINITEELKPQMNDVINRAQELIHECGGEAEFYPEQATTC